MLFYLGWNDFGKSWVSDWSPAEGVPDDNFVGGWNGAKAKGRKQRPASKFFLRLAKKTCEWQGTPEKFLVFRFFFYKKDEYEGTD